jgi:hypothetical protein
VGLSLIEIPLNERHSLSGHRRGGRVVQAQTDRFGRVGVVVGLIGLAVAVLSLWVLPMIFPPKPLEQVVVETARNIRDRAVSAARGVEQPAPRVSDEADVWYKVSTIAALALGLAAIALGAVSFLRREDLRYAGTAAALGVGAIAFELWMMSLAIAVALILLFAIFRYLDLGL